MTNFERLEVIDRIISRIAWLRSEDGLKWLEKNDGGPFHILRTIIVMCFTESVDKGYAPFSHMLHSVVGCIDGNGRPSTMNPYENRRPFSSQRDWRY